jgi:hypothetical protein
MLLIIAEEMMEQTREKLAISLATQLICGAVLLGYQEAS